MGEKSKGPFYTVKGDTIERTRRHCPQCGPGVWLARHKDRQACGKCGYTEKGAAGAAPEAGKPKGKPGKGKDKAKGGA